MIAFLLKRLSEETSKIGELTLEKEDFGEGRSEFEEEDVKESVGGHEMGQRGALVVDDDLVEFDLLKNADVARLLQKVVH